MHKFLSPSVRAKLIIRHKTERDSRVSDRIKSVLLSDEGWSCEEIAHALFLSDEAVRKHIKDYVESEKLKPENGGSASHLTVSEAKFLSNHLQEHTYVHVKEIVNFVERKFGKHYSVSGMTDWLYKNEFTYHKPARVPAKADGRKQKLWYRNYNNLKASLGSEDCILFSDGVHPTHEVRVVSGWIKKGYRKEIPTNASLKRMNILGALDIERMKFLKQSYATINSSSAIDFFNFIEKNIPGRGKIHLVLDCAGYNTSSETKAYLEDSERIVAHFLPAYSPNLNAIERLWKIMHEYVTHNQYYPKFKNFTDAVEYFFTKTFPKNANRWRSRLTDNFCIMHSPILTNS